MTTTLDTRIPEAQSGRHVQQPLVGGEGRRVRAHATGAVVIGRAAEQHCFSASETGAGALQQPTGHGPGGAVDHRVRPVSVLLAQESVFDPLLAGLEFDSADLARLDPFRDLALVAAEPLPRPVPLLLRLWLNFCGAKRERRRLDSGHAADLRGSGRATVGEPLRRSTSQKLRQNPNGRHTIIGASDSEERGLILTGED
ncbi:hypothetical protein [Streptomyces sp. TE5632]